MARIMHRARTAKGTHPGQVEQLVSSSKMEPFWLRPLPSAAPPRIVGYVGHWQFFSESTYTYQGNWIAARKYASTAGVQVRRTGTNKQAPTDASLVAVRLPQFQSSTNSLNAS